MHSGSAEEHSNCFFLKKVSVSSDSEQIFLTVWVEKNWHWSQRFRIVVRMNNLVSFYEWNVSLIMYFEQQTFRLQAIFRRESSQFFNFRIQRTFWFFFSQRNRLFMDYGLKNSSFGKKVFNSVFRSAFKMWKRTFLFFWLLIFFLLEAEHTLSKIGQKTRHFSHCSKILVQKNNLPSFPRENAFHFCTLGEKSFKLWEKLLQKSTLFFVFCVQRTFWY